MVENDIILLCFFKCDIINSCAKYNYIIVSNIILWKKKKGTEQNLKYVPLLYMHFCHFIVSTKIPVLNKLTHWNLIFLQEIDKISIKVVICWRRIWSMLDLRDIPIAAPLIKRPAVVNFGI